MRFATIDAVSDLAQYKRKLETLDPVAESFLNYVIKQFDSRRHILQNGIYQVQLRVRI